MRDRILWQPVSLYYPTSDFGILLDPAFAQDMMHSRLSVKNYDRIQEYAVDLIRGKRYTYATPYQFHENTCLIRQITLDGNGRWLEIDGLNSRRPDFKKPVFYSSHNLTCSSDAYAIMQLFDQWVEYADILKEQ